MILALIICILTGVGVFLTVLLKPEFRVGKIALGTYWVVSLTGAILLLVTGSIPLSELFGYATAIRSLSRGRASYSMEPSHFEKVPKQIQDKVVEKK